MSETGAEGALLRASVELFNDGEYLAAHEALEELWEAGFGESADFYKGLLQASIALHHFQLGNLGGVRKLYLGHRRYLAPYLPEHRGIAVSELLEEMQSFLRPVLRAAEEQSVLFVHEHRPRLRFVGAE